MYPRFFRESQATYVRLGGLPVPPKRKLLKSVFVAGVVPAAL